MFKTYSGKLDPGEIKNLMLVIKLYSTGKTLKSKSNLPDTHTVNDLSDKSNGQWKTYLN